MKPFASAHSTGVLGSRSSGGLCLGMCPCCIRGRSRPCLCTYPFSASASASASASSQASSLSFNQLSHHPFSLTSTSVYLHTPLSKTVPPHNTLPPTQPNKSKYESHRCESRFPRRYYRHHPQAILRLHFAPDLCPVLRVPPLRASPRKNSRRRFRLGPSS